MPVWLRACWTIFSLNVSHLVISDIKFYKNHSGTHLLFPSLITELCRRARVMEYPNNAWVRHGTPIYPLKIHGEREPSKSKNKKIDLGKSTCEEPKSLGHPLLVRLKILRLILGSLRSLFQDFPRGWEIPLPPAIHMWPDQIIKSTWRTMSHREPLLRGSKGIAHH